MYVDHHAKSVLENPVHGLEIHALDGGGLSEFGRRRHGTVYFSYSALRVQQVPSERAEKVMGSLRERPDAVKRMR